MTTEEDAEERNRRLERELERVSELYSISLRDYFSTFGTYATATSIFLAGLAFLVPEVLSSALVPALSGIGIFLCFQWHMSTTTMRDQYTHFYHRMIMLESELNQNIMRRFRDAANKARERERNFDPLAEEDARYLTWSYQQLDRVWALRGASLPVIYSAFFVAVSIALGPANDWPPSDEVATGCSLAWLVVGNLLVALEEKKARPPHRKGWLAAFTARLRLPRRHGASRT